MKIVSNFSDYYDCGLAWGRDEAVMYLRLKKELQPDTAQPGFPPFKACSRACWRHGTWYDDQNTTYKKVVGFCGKVYGALNFNKHGGNTGHHIEAWCYSVDDVDRFVEQHYSDDEKERYYQPPLKGKTYWRREYRDSKNAPQVERRFFVNEFFEEMEKVRSKHLSYFAEQGVPIFVTVCEKDKVYQLARSNNKIPPRLILNDCLKDVNFQKVFDPVAAFQEVSMFVAGMAVPSKPMPEISDETMRDIKGFDKWSFKKEPSKK